MTSSITQPTSSDSSARAAPDTHAIRILARAGSGPAEPPTLPTTLADTAASKLLAEAT